MKISIDSIVMISFCDWGMIVMYELLSGVVLIFVSLLKNEEYEKIEYVIFDI